jgi:hypothetical protein
MTYPEASSVQTQNKEAEVHEVNFCPLLSHQRLDYCGDAKETRCNIDVDG